MPGDALAAIERSGVIAVIRAPKALPLQATAAALAAAGVGALEITLTTPRALDSIRELTDLGLNGCRIGAGTVLDARGAAAALDAGADFLVSPTSEPEVLRVAQERGVLCIPGGLTPTELLAAWRAGATLLKVFPCSALGPGYFRDLLAPLPSLRLIPSGGVTLENAGEWIRAGAVAVSLGSALVPAALVARQDRAELASRARAVVERVAAARRERGSAGA